jgi:ElaB/YqjD/DUF883 family membrane-anchored ribosome-binding protein
MKNDIEENPQQEWQGEAQNLGSKVQAKARQFQETAQEWQRRATESTRRAALAADEYVHDNPWPVIGSVALGFFALGFLLGRSRD